MVIWELFSIFYYGFPLPNTAYAKMNIDVSLADKLIGGANYFKYNFFIDQITILIIFVAIFLVFFKKRKDLYPVAIGMILYISLYVFR
jgi:arabinofuranosyltransferase